MTAIVTMFVAVSVALTLIPGPDLMFVVRTGAHGRGPAVAAAFGAAASALVWGTAAAFGVAALLQRSAQAFEVVKLATAVACAAAAFLTWLRRPGVVRGLDRTTGVCMVGLGIRTALERA